MCPVCENPDLVADSSIEMQMLCEWHQRLRTYMAHREIAEKRVSASLALDDLWTAEYNPIT